MKPQKSNEIITSPDLYLTRSGRIAFLEAVRELGLDRKVFSGYVLGRTNGKASARLLDWHSCGTCISSNDDGDQIVKRVE